MIKQSIRRWLGFKDSQARIALSVNQVGRPVASPRNYDNFAAKGYQNNVIAYRCIYMIANACAGIEWELYSKRRGGGDPQEIQEHPLLQLIDRPNPMMAKAEFFEAFFAFFSLAGNSFVEAARPRPGQPPMELWPTSPAHIKIIPGPRGYVARYEFTANNITKVFPVDQITMKAADLMQMKSFHPRDPWWGMSPLEAAMWSLDQSNAGQKWNLALLQNSATPSGILRVLSTEANPNASLTEEQYGDLKAELDENSGPSKAGRPWLLEGGLDWTQISLSPKDMEFLKNKEVTAIDVALAYGVPPELLGLGQKTFANYKEARASFYEETVLPLMDKAKDSLNSWLVPQFGEGLVLKYNKDDIEALALKREAKFSMLKDAAFLTVNEKREAAGYAPVDSGDVFIIGQDVVSDLSDIDASTMIEPEEENAADLEAEDTENQDEIEDDDFDEEEEDEKGWKSFNLLTRNERRQSWKRQTWRKRRLEKAFQQDLQSDFAELASDMRRATSGKTDPKTMEFAVLKAIDENEPIIRRTIKRHISYSVRQFGEATFTNAKSAFPGKVETKQNRKWDDWAERFIEKRTGQAITEVIGTTRKKVVSTVKRLVQEAVIDGRTNEEIASELSEEISNISKARARTIAKTEVGMASANASIEAVRSLQLPSMVKEWISAQDDRVRDDENHADHAAMDGEEAELDEKFTVPPDTDMDGPGDPSAPPEQVINCRCVLGFKSRNNGEL